MLAKLAYKSRLYFTVLVFASNLPICKADPPMCIENDSPITEANADSKIDNQRPVEDPQQDPIPELPNTESKRLVSDKQLELQEAGIALYRSKKLLEVGRPLEARGLARSAAKIAEKYFGNKSCEYARCLSLLAKINCAETKYYDAEIQLESARGIFASQPRDPDWEPVRLAVDIDLGFVRTKLKRFEMAEFIYLELLKEIDGTTNPINEAILNIALGNLYLEMRDLSRAESFITKAYELLNKHTHENTPEYISAVLVLGKLNLCKNEHDDCHRNLERALELQHLNNPSDYLQYAHIASYLVDLYVAEGKVDSAIALLEHVSDAREAVLGKKHPFVQEANNRLAELQNGNLIK